MRAFFLRTKFLSTVPVLAFLLSSAAACNWGGSPQASPATTWTPVLTQTLTPTASSTFTPSPTPEGLLSSSQRNHYKVILRHSGYGVIDRLFAIAGYLQYRGYLTDIDGAPSAIGEMDIILYGDPSCNNALDDITILLKGKLDLEGLERKRFGSEDAAYEWTEIVIQIKSIELFGA